MASLIDALGHDLDFKTVVLVLDVLENALHDEEVWEPLLDSFDVKDKEAALFVLASDPQAVQKAKEIISKEESQEEVVCVEPPVFLSVRNNSPTIKDPMDILFDNKDRPFTPIQGAENRAISLRLLRRVLQYIESHAVDEDGNLPWIDRLEHSPTFGMRLNVHTINLHHVVDWIIKPLTESQQCSFVELLAPSSSEQKPRWFVSHAWSGPVQDFVACVAKHAQVRVGLRVCY